MKLSKNQKITLTLGQLKRLVAESNDIDRNVLSAHERKMVEELLAKSGVSPEETLELVRDNASKWRKKAEMAEKAAKDNDLVNFSHALANSNKVKEYNRRAEACEKYAEMLEKYLKERG